MNLRRGVGPLVFLAGMAVSGTVAALGGELDRHWDAYAALRTPPRTELRREMPMTAVSFQFSTREEGHEILLSDVHVTIVSAVAGTLFQGVSEGPFLIASVPAGNYEVVASHAGRAQRMLLTVAQGEPRRVALYW